MNAQNINLFDNQGNHFFLDLSRCIQESNSLKKSMEQFLCLLKKLDEWQIVLLWEWNSEINVLKCIEVSSGIDEALEDFKKISSSLELSYQKEAAPFQAFKEKKRVFVNDMKRDPRETSAQQAGIDSGLIIPLFNDFQLGYVLEIYKKGSIVTSSESNLHILIDWIQLQYEIFIKNNLIKNQLKTHKTILNSLVDAVYSCDIKGNVKTWNKGCELIYKWPEEEILGKSIKIFIPDQEQDHFNFLLQNFSQGKSLIHLETNAINKNKEIFVIHTTYTPIRNTNNELMGVAISAHDATCQAREKEAIQKSEEKYRSVIETTQEWIWEVDHHLQIIYSNHSVKNILGFSEEEIIGKELSSIIIEQEDLHYFQEHKTWKNQVFRIKRKNNEVCYLECSAIPFQVNHFEDKIGFRMISRDISTRVQLEQMKEEFISIISHELRTPLASIIASLDLLKSEERSKEENQKILAIIEKNSHLLNELIDNVLIIERLQSNRLEVSTERISLKQLVDCSIECTKVLADKKQINLRNELKDDIFINSDFALLSQVLINFLSNAIKFSHENSEIKIFTQTQEQCVQLLVADQGRGISKNFKGKIFQKFAQEDLSTKHTHKGTGLGLYICKQIITKLGGEIGFTSEETKGSTFYFSFQIAE